MPTVEFYLQRGFDEDVARYYAQGRRRAVSVVVAAPQKLLIEFDDGEFRLFDMAPLIRPGTVFSFLSDGRAFSRVHLDDTGAIAWDIDPTVDSTEAWTNQIDISPDTCYLDGEPVVPGLVMQ